MTLLIVAFSGPSGSGKSTLLDSLLELYPDNCCKFQQFTSRPRRPGEGSAQYVFVSPRQYEAMRPVLTCRTGFGGNLYGTMPEVMTEKKAVLTIADAEGLRDIWNDVTQHNRLLAEGPAGGKFGAEPVRLVKVFFRYQLDEVAVFARGRSDRGLEFVEAEEKELIALAAHFSQLGDPVHTFVDTTDDLWPDPSEFFESVVWPELCAPQEGPPAEIARLAAEIADAIEAGAADALFAIRALEAMRGLAAEARLATARPAGPPQAQEAEADPLDDALALVEVAPAKLPETAEEWNEAWDRASMRAAEIDPAPPEAEAEAFAGAVAEAEAILEPLAAEPESPLPPEGAAEQASQDPPRPAPEDGAPGAAHPDGTAFTKFTTLRAVTEAAPVVDFVLRSGMGANAFKDLAAFQGMFSAYLRENAVVLKNNVEYNVGASRDAKGGLVMTFLARAGRENFVVAFNHRIMQTVKVEYRAD